MPYLRASILNGALVLARSLRSCLSSIFVNVRRGGLPIRFPSRRACAIPARTRSRNRSRSNSATVDRTPKTSRPDGELVSRSCFTATKSTLSRCNSSEISSNCLRLLANLSRAQIQIAENRPRRTCLIISSNAGRLSLAPLCPLSRNTSYRQPRCSTNCFNSASCASVDCAFVDTRR